MKEIVLVKHQGNFCKILKVWDGGYYDLETVEETENGIIETYLSVHISDIDTSETKNILLE